MVGVAGNPGQGTLIEVLADAFALAVVEDLREMERTYHGPVGSGSPGQILKTSKTSVTREEVARLTRARGNKGSKSHQGQLKNTVRGFVTFSFGPPQLRLRDLDWIFQLQTIPDRVS